MHEDYQTIMSMGAAVIPLILKQQACRSRERLLELGEVSLHCRKAVPRVLNMNRKDPVYQFDLHLVATAGQDAPQTGRPEVRPTFRTRSSQNFKSPMRTRLAILGLLAVIALAVTSTISAYRIGYRTGYHQGGVDERSCWVSDPAPLEAWRHGQITARRDTVKYPFLKGRYVLSPIRSVNAVPVTYVP